MCNSSSPTAMASPNSSASNFSTSTSVSATPNRRSFSSTGPGDAAESAYTLSGAWTQQHAKSALSQITVAAHLPPAVFATLTLMVLGLGGGGSLTMSGGFPPFHQSTGMPLPYGGGMPVVMLWPQQTAMPHPQTVPLVFPGCALQCHNSNVPVPMYFRRLFSRKSFSHSVPRTGNYFVFVFVFISEFKALPQTEKHRKSTSSSSL